MECLPGEETETIWKRVEMTNEKIKPTLKFTAVHQVVELHPKILRSPAEVREVRAGKKKKKIPWNL